MYIGSCVYFISLAPIIVPAFFSVKPRIMDKDSLKPIRIKVGQNFNVPVSFVGEPAPEVIWTIRGMVGVHTVLFSFAQS